MQGFEQLHMVNRLDRLTSGVMLLPWKKEDAVILQNKIIKFEVTKEYICRVVGEFPACPLFFLAFPLSCRLMSI